MNTAIVNRRSPHIPRKSPLVTASRGSVHHTRVVPHDQIPIIQPFDTDYIFRLTGMRIQFLDQTPRFLDAQTFDVMHVRGNVQIHPTTGLMSLHESVSAHGKLFGVNVLEEVWTRGLAGVVEGVCGNVVIL